MTFTTELFIKGNFFHVNVVSAGSHLKDGRVTNLTFKLNPVKPMRENDGRHAPLFGFTVEHHVGVEACDLFSSTEPEGYAYQ